MTVTAPTASATTREARVVVGKVTRSYQAVVPGAGSYEVEAERGFALRVSFSEGLWTVVDTETGIYGAGEEPSAAVRDFQRAATEHLDVLERQDALSEDLRWQRDYLSARVRRSA